MRTRLSHTCPPSLASSCRGATALTPFSVDGLENRPPDLVVQAVRVVPAQAMSPAGLRGFIGQGRLHPKPNACCPVSSQLGAGHEAKARSVDRLDHDRMSGAARANRGHPLLTAHAHP